MGWKGVLAEAVVLAGLIGFNVEPARAQSEAVVRGQLVTEADGWALPEGRVVLKAATGWSTAATTDAEGRFAFSGVAPGASLIT